MRRAVSGEEVIVARDNKPLLRLVPVARAAGRRTPGSARGFDGHVMLGNITSKNALKLIREWAQLHRPALDANWANISAGKPLDRIPPLE